jgi:polyisoprenoid-binding protein YceI
MTVARPTSRRGPVLAAIGAGAVIVVVAMGLWYLFLQPGGPAPVSLATAVPAASAAQGSDPAATPAASAGGTAPAAGGGDGITGTWAVDPSIGSFSDFSGSFVGYRVKETLANVGATEAVGRTADVTGSFTVDGTTITAASFKADLSTLRSDKQFRDDQLHRQALETDRFPEASFTLTSPVDLGAVPAEGATVEVGATGDLSLHGVTKSVEIPLRARRTGDVVTVTGTLPVVFADFGITPPQAMVVLSVEDNGVMEFQLQLART